VIVVSDTSPIRDLNHLGLLPVVFQLYGQLWVPTAVASELEHPASPFAPIFVSRIPNVQIRSVVDTALAAKLEQDLDRGEAEAIALAVESKAAMLLIDESAGRQVANQMGLKYIGALGVLVAAKKSGFIPAVRSLLDRLRKEISFWISDAVYDKVCQLAGE
jgi:predicted nucleic acid-binding protein